MNLRTSLLTVAAFLGLAAASQAAPPRTTYFPIPTYNPNYYIAPGLTIGQYAYNMSVLGQAMQQVPPYALGYNPYPSVLNVRPNYVAPTYNAYSPYGAYYPGTYGTYPLYPYSPLYTPLP